MQFLELKIPPSLVALATGVLMWLASSLMPPFDISDIIRIGAALALALIGISLDLTGLIAFLCAKTTINPLKPIWRRVRHAPKPGAPLAVRPARFDPLNQSVP